MKMRFHIGPHEIRALAAAPAEPSGSAATFDLEPPASGSTALLTGATGGHPAPVEPSQCEWHGCPAVQTHGSRYCEPHSEKVADEYARGFDDGDTW